MAAAPRHALGGRRLGALLLVLGCWPAAAQPDDTCLHCDVGGGFEEFLKRPAQINDGEHSSDVHVLWPAQVEVIPITSDLGGWEPPEFHQKLAQEAVKGWRAFQKKIVPKIPKGHLLRHQLEQKHAGALNDAFFHWQKNLFEESGDVAASIGNREGPVNTPPPGSNTTWPEMNALPEYQKLRRIVERLSRKYLIRAGMSEHAALGVNYSIFNWAAVHGPGEFHGPHTHVGEYHSGVFYAQVGPAGGKIRFGDPRGHSPPFGRSFTHSPKSGHLVFFPSWLSHMATVTSPTSDLPKDYDKEPLRVVFSFNIGPVTGPLPCHHWWSDPTGDMRFTRPSKINTEELGL